MDSCGILRTLTPLGARAAAHQYLGVVADPLGEREPRSTHRRPAS